MSFFRTARDGPFGRAYVDRGQIGALDEEGNAGLRRDQSVHGLFLFQVDAGLRQPGAQGVHPGPGRPAGSRGAGENDSRERPTGHRTPDVYLDELVVLRARPRSKQEGGIVRFRRLRS